MELVKDISGCGIAGFINTDGERISGTEIVDAITLMKDRGNGLGAGYAAYGIYPDFKDFYALHIMYDDEYARKKTEEYLERKVHIEQHGGLPTRPIKKKRPIFFVYFVQPREQSTKGESEEFRLEEADEFIFKLVMFINEKIDGAFVVSSGKNMGVFKGVGFPDEIANFFRVDEYKAFCWTAHNRFPTNTPGWWGGAHPFSLLGWSVVHNGEISSYGANKRYLEMFGYKCTQKTDTEVVAYLLDLLIRKHGHSLNTVAKIFAPPLWSEIEIMDDKDKELYTALRMVYGGAMLNGPFSIIVGFRGGMFGLNDRIKLRPLVVAKKGANVYMASEESAIRFIADDLDEIYMPKAGEPVIAMLSDEAFQKVYGTKERSYV